MIKQEFTVDMLLNQENKFDLRYIVQNMIDQETDNATIELKKGNHILTLEIEFTDYKNKNNEEGENDDKFNTKIL